MRATVILWLTGMALMILIGVILSGLTSCGYTRDKAQSAHGRAVTSFPEIGAAFCADKYPVRVRTDSTGYLASRRTIDSLAQVLRDDSLITVFERESLMAEIDRIRAEMPMPEDCDSLSEGIYRLVAKERQRGDRLQRANEGLIRAVGSLKPIRDTVENTARVRECEIIRDKAVLLAEDYKKEAAEWKAKAKKRFWVIAGMGAAMALGLFLAIRRKVVKQVA
jgi:hypothetical protein